MKGVGGHPRSRWIALSLWLWIGVALALYLVQFRDVMVRIFQMLVG